MLDRYIPTTLAAKCDVRLLVAVDVIGDDVSARVTVRVVSWGKQMYEGEGGVSSLNAWSQGRAARAASAGGCTAVPPVLCCAHMHSDLDDVM